MTNTHYYNLTLQQTWPAPEKNINVNHQVIPILIFRPEGLNQRKVYNFALEKVNMIIEIT